MKRRAVLYWLLAIFATTLLTRSAWAETVCWPQFRGPGSRSVADAQGLPVHFDLQTKENVAWIAELPGRGPSGPIVCRGRVFVTCSSGFRQDRLHLLCFDAESGERLWGRRTWATGHTSYHPFGAIACNTPATDGSRIFAFYSSNDLACFDLDGNLKWIRGLAYENPSTRNDVGMSSSPVVYGDLVIVQLENQGESFATGIDAETGRTVWRIEREKDAAWCSPIILPGETPEQDVLILQSRSSITANDPRTGRQVWRYETSPHTIASCTTSGANIYLPANGLHRIRFDGAEGRGEVLWGERRLRGDNASPIVDGDKAYVIKPPGILLCADAATGDIHWQLRLKGPFWATPVLADGKWIGVNHKGEVQIVDVTGDEGRLLAEIQIEPGILASPAIASNAIYFRGDRYLVKVKQTR